MEMVRRVPLVFLLLIVAAAVTGCATDTGSTNPRIPVPSSTAELRPGDSLTITLQGVPDPSTNAVTIDSAGRISLPYIGAIPAAGMNSAQLSESIQKTYVARNIYTSVDVSVSAAERYVYVGGEVQHPNRIVWTPDLTASKAIQAAGGFTLYAKETAVRLIRGDKSYLIDVRLARRNPTQDPPLVPGDSIEVPRSPF